MPQSRYLFAISCFQMNLLSEAEAALCPANEPGAEVPNGAPGHYLLGQVYRYTDRKKSAINHFKQALLMDPLMWAAYEELCILAEDCHVVATRHSVSEDMSPRQLRHMQGLKDIAANPHGSSIIGGAAGQLTSSGSSNMSFYNTPSPMATQLSAVAPPPLCRNVMPNGPNLSTLNSDNSPKSTVNSTIQAPIQAPRRKFVGEGRLRKISGRLFSDSGPRRSSRLSSEASVTSNANATIVSGNGTSNSYKGGSKLGPMTFRTMTIRKGQSWANENIDGGIHNDVLDVSRLNTTSTTSCSSAAIEAKSYEQDAATLQGSEQATSESKVITGVSEILSLLRVLGEGYRLACLYKCQEALDTYLKLPQRHYNTGWVLSQVGKAHYELVDNLEADRVFSLARQIAPYSLEGMDIYSTVLYRSEEALAVMEKAILADKKNLLPMYQKANILMGLERFDEALEVLEELKEYAPYESSVFALMGNIYKRRNMHERAMFHYGIALDLKPTATDAATIKAAIEKLYLPDELEDNM
ncbi:hypothetical protein TSUD_277010 [Trifolium subterraneum]|uniref:Cdc23 domain-containing protein n=2 Tax=Trifolium TaxID=3898 RepID=A0A2Z6NI14_TRISU|nr:hypothetical protein TSUD_277010 [Trifolium subterraneum]